LFRIFFCPFTNRVAPWIFDGIWPTFFFMRIWFCVIFLFPENLIHDSIYILFQIFGEKVKYYVGGVGFAPTPPEKLVNREGKGGGKLNGVASPQLRCSVYFAKLQFSEQKIYKKTRYRILLLYLIYMFIFVYTISAYKVSPNIGSFPAPSSKTK